jgi:Uma2 family endonuclease
MATALTHQVPEQAMQPFLQITDEYHDGEAVSLDQYLNTTYKPDCDYVDGHLQERNLGELEHGALQAHLVILFAAHRQELQVKIVTEVRLQTTPANFRVPDLMLLRADHKEHRIVRNAPLLCIEILSPSDTWGRLTDRIQEYLTMGVPAVWAFDPDTREAYLCDANGFHKVTASDLTIPDTPIRLTLADIFPAA